MINMRKPGNRIRKCIVQTDDVKTLTYHFFIASMASCSPRPRKMFDVILSYYGRGSRYNFVDDILYALERRGVSTHMDDISAYKAQLSILSQGIFDSSSSSVAVIIFCRDYSTTPKCLDELVKIIKLSKADEGGLIVLPVFYYVDPLELQNSDWTFPEIRRRSSYRFSEAFGAYSERNVKLWKQAILELTNLQGLTLSKNNTTGSDDHHFVEEIAETVIRNLGRRSGFDENVVELVKPHTKNARSLKAKSGVHSSKPSMDDSLKLQNFGWTYDVFLSFRGEDTRKNFVDHLRAALEGYEICTFNDNETLDRGKSIAPELLRAIEESAISVIIFSKNYASSTWCLDELVKIMSCRKKSGHIVFPVFYDVSPSDVRKQEGLFGEGFARNYKTDKMEMWREALVEAANLSGWDLKTAANGHEATCIKDIVKKIQRELNQITPVTVDDNLIGLEHRIEEVISLLDGPDDVCMIGIWGMGGAGKTTLARALFDEISYHFEGTSFLDNIREISQQYGLQHLQKLLLEDVTKEDDFRVRSVVDGKRMLIKRLARKKIFLVLDDVDAQSHIEALAGAITWFGKGSRVLITTRDEHVLVRHGIKGKNIYKISLLNDNEASQLFKCYAFKRSIPSKEYDEASQQVVQYATGLPLTLKVLGSFLCGKSLAEWTSALNKLKKIPEKETMEILKISYDSLDHEYQEAFLHIACFFRGWEKDVVFRILESCEFYPHIVTRVLVQKSLINISNEHLLMHDLIQEMGKDIVRRMQPDELGRRSRLWDPHEVADVLKENTGKEEIKAIVVGNLHEVESINMSEAFKNMRKLRLLYFHAMVKEMTPHGPEYLPNELRWLTWKHFSLGSLPESFHANKLVGLEMPHSKIEQLWDRREVKVLHKLKFLDLSYSKLTKTPDFNQIPNLERLNLGCCFNLLEVHTSIGVLQRLVYLSLFGCSNLKHLPESLGNLVCLAELNVSHCMIEELPRTIGNLCNLVQLNLTYCENLKSLPNTISRLCCLETLDLHHCSNLKELPENLDGLERLEYLIASSSGVRHLPDAISRLKCLKTLDLHHCLRIETPLNLNAVYSEIGIRQNLAYLNLSCCIQLKEFPESIGDLKNLSKLDLSHNTIQELPSSIGNLTKLIHLNLTYCKNLERLPITIVRLKDLKTLQLHGCISVESLPENIGQLESLEDLIVSSTSIRSIPNSIRRCKHLKDLNVHDCKSLTYLPPALGDMESLEVFRASNSAIMVIPDSICSSKSLRVLDLRGCFNLQELPTYLSNIESLEEIYISGTRVSELPPSIDGFKVT
ncbi:hypothetical protein QVD17_26401 [Tagetes erecta]|uniref:TIR domain-containing protein n=1 Tax=Tagetes erecta TaxID=13708 RepID=A0AAD8K6H9_TARER|nr:hypothetical protein QVD17_26401 [Tagetes erecta]